MTYSVNFIIDWYYVLSNTISMKTITLIFVAGLLSACGAASGGGSGGPASAIGVNPVGGGGAPANLNCEMDVTGNDNDFNFAPAIIGTGANEVNPGPQLVNFGQTKVYSLVDTSCDFQITGIGASNGAFTVSVVVKVDGIQVAQWQVGVGVSEEYRTN